MTLGEKIKYARNKKGLTQKELAKKIGVSLRSLQYYESDKVNPSVAVVERIANVCDISFNYFIVQKNTDLFDTELLTEIVQPSFIDFLNDFVFENKDYIFNEGYKHSEVLKIFNSVEHLKEIVDFSENDQIRKEIYMGIDEICNCLYNYYIKLENTSKDNLMEKYVRDKSKVLREVLEYIEKLLYAIYSGVAENKED